MGAGSDAGGGAAATGGGGMSERFLHLQRRAMVKLFFAGFSFHEVARLFGVPVFTVEQVVREACR